MNKLSLYIHIPFCESKCKYCDFTSFKGNDEMINSYIKALGKEIEIYSKNINKEKVKTIFIGGGTPSSINPKYIEFILDKVYKNYNMDSLEELTIETNPGTIDLEKAKIYKQMGVNRVSMGAQSFNDNILKNLGRIHNEKDIYSTIDLFRRVGIENLNLDLMFSLPNQSLDDMLISLKKAIDLEIPHISNYSLILEKGTVLYNEYKNGKYPYIQEDLDRDMYHKSNEILINSQYNHYEISNFAKKGYECNHNLVYWNIEPYIGLGVSSHSNLYEERFANTNNIRKYIVELDGGKLPIETREKISIEEEIAEYAIMGFRKIDGINITDFEKRFNLNFNDYFKYEIEKNLKLELINVENNYIKLTSKGLDLSNRVELDFYKI